MLLSAFSNSLLSPRVLLLDFRLREIHALHDIPDLFAQARLRPVTVVTAHTAVVLAAFTSFIQNLKALLARRAVRVQVPVLHIARLLVRAHDLLSLVARGLSFRLELRLVLA